MSESKLRELSMDFSVNIIELVKHLKSMKESIISNQIGRSGTSIGANIHEAPYAQGKRDFISKLEIALKEASETGYWEIVNFIKYQKFTPKIHIALFINECYNSSKGRLY